MGNFREESINVEFWPKIGRIHRCFPVIFAKFLRIPFLQDTSGRQLLKTRSHVCIIAWFMLSQSAKIISKGLKVTVLHV